MSSITGSGTPISSGPSRRTYRQNYHRQPSELQATLQGEGCLIMQHLIPESFLAEHQLAGEEHRSRETLGDLMRHMFKFVNRISAQRAPVFGIVALPFHEGDILFQVLLGLAA